MTEAETIELADDLEATLQRMACTASVPMDLWDLHSNLVLKAIAQLRIAPPQPKRME